MRCDAMRCDAMRCDAMRCDAMRCDAMRCDENGFLEGSREERTNLCCINEKDDSIHHTQDTFHFSAKISVSFWFSNHQQPRSSEIQRERERERVQERERESSREIKPGVSTMLILKSLRRTEVFFAKIVIPRSCSSALQSIRRSCSGVSFLKPAKLFVSR